jgi:hypothetical protein
VNQADRDSAYAHALWFPNEEYHLVEIEQSVWWSVHKQLREALGRCNQLEAKNCQLRALLADLRADVLLRDSERRPKTKDPN